MTWHSGVCLYLFLCTGIYYRAHTVHAHWVPIFMTNSKVLTNQLTLALTNVRLLRLFALSPSLSQQQPHRKNHRRPNHASGRIKPIAKWYTRHSAWCTPIIADDKCQTRARRSTQGAEKPTKSKGKLLSAHVLWTLSEWVLGACAHGVSLSRYFSLSVWLKLIWTNARYLIDRLWIDGFDACLSRCLITLRFAFSIAADSQDSDKLNYKVREYDLFLSFF